MLEWYPKQVVADVRAEVRDILETAGEVVRVDARSNLLRVKEPEFGKKYRAILALYRLKSILVEDRNSIEVKIGIPKGEKGDRYGYYIELGSSTAPANPWIRPALDKNLKNIMQLFNTGSK